MLSSWWTAVSAPLVLPPGLRLWGRISRRRLAIWRRRLRGLSPGAVPRVFPAVRLDRGAVPLRHPAIAVVLPPDADRTAIQQLVDLQSERSVSFELEAASTAPFLWLLPKDGPPGLPSTTLEALLLALTSEPLAFAVMTATSPVALEHGASAAGEPAHVPSCLTTLMRNPLRATAGQPGPAGVVGRLLPQLGPAPHLAPGESSPPGSMPGDELPLPFLRSGPYFLDPDAAGAGILETRVSSANELLVDLPPLARADQRRRIAFLLPFLAVGGAERLLRDLLDDFTRDTTCLVITLEPHRAELGETVAATRQLTDSVYTLGDWLPRAAVPPALLTLLRRHQVDTVVSWNGSITFYDLLPELRRTLPELHIVHQLFDWSHGFFARTTPKLARLLDAHLAANRATAEALRRRGIDADTVHLVHHGVAVAPLPDVRQLAEDRRRIRAELGLPTAAVIVGTFARLHAQKRPLDMVALARRLAADGYHFVWLGGGPFESAMRAELARQDPGNLTLLPLSPNPESMFAALDICLLPSAFEGLPVFLLEGLAHGIPCVATAVGDVPLLFAGGGGHTAAPGDLVGLERGLRLLADSETRAIEGARGRQTVVAQFSRAKFIAENRRVILGPPASGPPASGTPAQ